MKLCLKNQWYIHLLARLQQRLNPCLCQKHRRNSRLFRKGDLIDPFLQYIFYKYFLLVFISFMGLINSRCFNDSKKFSSSFSLSGDI